MDIQTTPGSTKIKAPPEEPSRLNIPEALKNLAQLFESLRRLLDKSSQIRSSTNRGTVQKPPDEPENSPGPQQDNLPQFQQTEEEPPNDETQERQIYRDSRGCIYITLCSLSAALAWLIINLITNNKDD